MSRLAICLSILALFAASGCTPAVHGMRPVTDPSAYAASYAGEGGMATLFPNEEQSPKSKVLSPLYSCFCLSWLNFCATSRYETSTP